jgi:glutamyl-tRNA synthetase
MNEIRVRFAPSPTGYLHVGGARTALFNWLFARQHHGTFILRIEDTDVERSSEEMVTGIVEGLQWLGLDWDEGPHFQSERLIVYQERARALVESGHAYYCFCSPDDLAAKRAPAEAGSRRWQYDRTCRALPPTDVQQNLASHASAAIRFKVPPDSTTAFDDAVYGRVEVQNDGVEDFVLLRSDGHPTYHLSVVVDDVDMRITHVIRGADHLSNTPKQVLLYRAFGLELPVFAHVPLILGPDRSRLSKRHGATSVMAYRDLGFVPAAFRNFLVLLGWSPGDTDQEVFSTEELIGRFSLEGISKTNAVFNLDKAIWMNAQYLRAMAAEELEPLVGEELKKAGLWSDELAGRDRGWFLHLIDLLKARARTLHTFVDTGRPYLSDDYPFIPEAVEKNFKHPELKELLPELADRFEHLESFTLETTEQALRQLAGERQIKAGVLINAARTALTGDAVSPGIFDVMVAIGNRRTVERLRRSVRFVDNSQDVSV